MAITLQLKFYECVNISSKCAEDEDQVLLIKFLFHPFISV